MSDANSAWVGQGTELLAPYKDALASLFNADARQLTSAAEVNSWVAKATHDKIQTIIDDGVVRSAALVLVNAIYFKGLWEAPFSKMDTMRMPFHLRDGSTMDAPHMYTHLKEGTAIQGAKLSAAMGAGQPEVPCIAVKMAYQGGAYSAVLAMPAPPLQDTPEGQTREKLTLEGGIDYTDALAACRAEVTRRLAGNGNGGIPWMSIGHPQMAAAKVYLPRFEVEFGTSLGDVLKEAGLTAPFSAGDFTRMTAAGDLEVSDVVHKVYVKADEKGTEAAAATAVVMVRMAIMNPPPELFVRFDRPFVFSIVHEPSGLALFTGEVYKPEKWEG